MKSAIQADKEYKAQLRKKFGNDKEYDRIKKFEPETFRQAIINIRINKS